MTTEHANTIVKQIADESQAELLELIEQESFRTICIEIAKKMGVPSNLWNNDTTFRMAFYGHMAIQYINNKSN
jgi:hypothetical protein